MGRRTDRELVLQQTTDRALPPSFPLLPSISLYITRSPSPTTLRRRTRPRRPSPPPSPPHLLPTPRLPPLYFWIPPPPPDDSGKRSPSLRKGNRTLQVFSFCDSGWMDRDDGGRWDGQAGTPPVSISDDAWLRPTLPRTCAQKREEMMGLGCEVMISWVGVGTEFVPGQEVATSAVHGASSWNQVDQDLVCCPLLDRLDLNV